MSLTVDENIYLPIGIEYDPVLVMAAITGATILLNTITEIADGLIINDHIASSTIVASEKIQASSIETNQIAANAITSTRINANAITADKIAADAVTSVKIYTAAITSDKIYAGAVTASKINVTSLEAISANLGSVTAGVVTGATLQTGLTGSRVVINSAGISGYDTSLGLTLRIPTDGSAPIFASGRILSATIVDTTIQSNDFKTSSELPWIEIKDSASGGIALRFNSGGSVYDTDIYDTGTYGEGTAANLFKSDKPILHVAVERSFADIHLYNRSSDVPSGASEIGDLICINAIPKFCTVADTPGTYKDIVLDGSTVASLTLTTADINGGTFDGIIGGTTPAAGSFTTISGALTGNVTGNASTVTTNANLTGVVTSVGNATSIANKAIAIAKLADGTDGQLITWDANGVIAVVETGTDTHVLTSNGEGTAPTFKAPDKLTLQEVYPVNSVYIEISGTNPNTTFGFGTWVAFGAGRVPVGYDSADTDFDTVEETGGVKTHSLSIAELASHSHNILIDSTYAGSDKAPTTADKDEGAGGAVYMATETSGSGTAHTNVQPYIVVHMWKRTA